MKTDSTVAKTKFASATNKRWIKAVEVINNELITVGINDYSLAFATDGITQIITLNDNVLFSSSNVDYDYDNDCIKGGTPEKHLRLQLKKYFDSLKKYIDCIDENSDFDKHLPADIIEYDKLVASISLSNAERAYHNIASVQLLHDDYLQAYVIVTFMTERQETVSGSDKVIEYMRQFKEVKNPKFV